MAESPPTPVAWALAVLLWAFLPTLPVLATVSWHTLQAQGVELRYTEPDRTLVASLWPILRHDRLAIMDRLRLFPTQPLTVVLSPTREAFRAALPPGVDPDVLGLYVSREHTIYLRAPRTEPGAHWDLRGVLRHELTHGVIDTAIREPVPVWLHEGLAVLMSDELSFLDEARLTLLAAVGRLIPLPLLIDSFPHEATQRSVAYAEAASFVRYLLHRDGMHGVQALLTALARGVGSGEAFRDAYGESLYDLEQGWIKDLAGRFSWLSLITTTTVLGGLGVPLLLAGVLRRVLERRRKYREWEQEAHPPAPGEKTVEAARRPEVRSEPLEDRQQPPDSQAGPEGQRCGWRYSKFRSTLIWRRPRRSG